MSAERTTAAHRARGDFEATLDAQSQDQAEASTLARYSLDKRYRGELEGVGRGEMLTAGGAAKGSAAYVAVERVTGTLHGRSGSFALVHRGVMSGGRQELLITIVPDSGSGELAGIAGTMTIEIAGGKHTYALEYALGG